LRASLRFSSLCRVYLHRNAMALKSRPDRVLVDSYFFSDLMHGPVLDGVPLMQITGYIGEAQPVDG